MNFGEQMKLTFEKNLEPIKSVEPVESLREIEQKRAKEYLERADREEYFMAISKEARNKSLGIRARIKAVNDEVGFPMARVSTFNPDSVAFMQASEIEAFIRGESGVKKAA